jgi:hypothetical protein
MPDGKISISRAGDLGLEREMELWLLISGWRGTVSVNEVRAWSAGGEGEGGGEGWERRSRSGEMCFLLFRCPSSEVSSRRGQHGQAAIKIKPNAKSRVRSPTMTPGVSVQVRPEPCHLRCAWKIKTQDEILAGLRHGHATGDSVVLLVDTFARQSAVRAVMAVNRIE